MTPKLVVIEISLHMSTMALNASQILSYQVLCDYERIKMGAP